MAFNLKRIYAVVTVIGVTMIILMMILYVAGARINVTKSLAVGLYWTVDAPIEKGAYVIFCPPDINVFAVARERNYIMKSGFCPGKYGYMLKRIAATGGETITVTDKGLLVNGALLPHSKLKTADAAGRKLPHYPFNQYTLARSELLLMSDVNDASFDGRYFGPVSRSQIKSVVRPIFTW